MEGPVTAYTNSCVKRFAFCPHCSLRSSNPVQVNEPGYSWVSRHTWQSWRERYKKNSARLDVAVANIVTRRPVLPGEKGQYGYVRFTEEKGKRIKRSPKQEGPVPLDLHSVSGSTSAMRNSAPAPNNATYPVPAAKNSAQPHSALLEESQEGSEWAIKIGDASPPAWGKKRSLSQEGASEVDPKRKRVDSGYVFWSFVHPGQFLSRVLPRSLPHSLTFPPAQRRRRLLRQGDCRCIPIHPGRSR